MPKTNKIFSTTHIKTYLLEYIDALSQSLASIDGEALEKVVQLLTKTAQSGNHVFVAGNGGSASVANHLCCDWTKGTYTSGHPPLRAHSFMANEAVLTACANDFGYSVVIAKQLEFFAKKKDVIVLISSSGESMNVVEAAKTARHHGLYSIGFTGFSGGELAKLVDIHVHVPFENYGVIEDSHQILMHTITQYLAAIWVT